MRQIVTTLFLLVACGDGTIATTGPSHGFGPTPTPTPPPIFVDLRSFGVTANCTTCNTANTAGVVAAVTAFATTGAELRFPAGTIYLDEGGSTSAFGSKSSVLLDAKHDFVLSGEGMYATTLAGRGTGDNGAWSVVEIGDGSARVEVKDLGIAWSTVTNPPDSTHGHDLLVSATNGQSASTMLVSIHDVYFGTTIADALHVAGGTTALVEHVRMLNTMMSLGGSAHSAVGVAGGYNDVEVGSTYAKGASGTLVNVAGAGTAVENGFSLHDAVIDNTSGTAYVALQIAGASATVPATNALVHDVWVTEGGVLLQDTDHSMVTSVHVLDTSATPNASTATLHAYHRNSDLTIRDADVQRLSGATAGDVVLVDDLSSSAAPLRVSLLGGRFVQQTQGTGIELTNCDQCALRGGDLRWEGGTPSTARAVTLTASSYDLTGFASVGLKISATSALADCYYFNASANNIASVMVTNTSAAAACTNGVRYDAATSKTVDATPVLQGNAFGGATSAWVAVNNAVNKVFPLTGGSRGAFSAAHVYEGTVAPEGVLVGIQGDSCTFLNGDSTARYYKATGTGNTGWKLTSEFISGVTISGGHFVVTGTAPALTSCGTSPSIVGSDVAGTITEGTLATGCTMTFAGTYGTSPSCTWYSESNLGFTVSPSAAAVTITNVGALSGTKIDYFCGGH